MELVSTDFLVSVCVITYNSSKYVLETLDSIKNQTYQRIELIICDDCSKDDTTQLCKEWIENNITRFASVKLLDSKLNLGIAPNINRAYKVAQGEWVKSIAGDDVLLPTCIECNVSYVINHPEISVLQSYNQYIDSDSKLMGLEKYKKNDDFFFREATSAYFQYQILLRKYVANTVSLFLKREAYLNVGGFDESIKMLEDYPMWLRLTSSGFKIYFMEEVTTLYRIHSQSISVGGNNNAKKILPPIYLYNLLVKKKYIIPNLFGLERVVAIYMVFVTRMFMNSFFNNKNVMNNCCWRILQSPSILINKLLINKLHKKISI